jgi:hypothetical protein
VEEDEEDVVGELLLTIGEDDLREGDERAPPEL